jgi:superfamily II DNA helicase RecQ
MLIKIFTIPIPGGEAINDDLNALLRSKKVLEVESQIVSSAHGAHWCFCVKYLDEPAGERKKVDYREVLAPPVFQRFERMRELRRQIAQEEAAPAYTVFTDEEMAALAKMERLTPEAMNSVKGIGKNKIEKYGARFIQLMQGEKG